MPMVDKDYIFQIVSLMIGDNATEILIPSSEYEYGISDDPAVSMSEDNEIWEIEDCHGYHVMRGATKVVIIPSEEDFVIKLNITGTYLTEKECQDYGLEYPHMDRRSKQNVLDEENAIYEDIGMRAQKFIKPNIYVGDFNNIPVYIQEKIKIAYDFGSGPSEKKYSKTEDNIKWIVNSIGEMTKPAGWHTSLFPNPFIYDMIQAYGEDDTAMILAQLRDAAIYDLNYGNFGYDMKGLPCLFDIGGFSEEEFFSYDE